MSGHGPRAVDTQRALEQFALVAPGAPNALWRSSLRQQFVGASAVRQPMRKGVSGVVVAATAALAAAAALIVCATLPSGSQWQLVAGSGHGQIRIGARWIPVADSVALTSALRTGVAVEVPATAQLDIVLPGSVLMQITGGTGVTIPSRPGRWLNRDMQTALSHGEVRITTGPGFHGARLVVNTHEARAMVTGTTLAVLRGADSTCVCVFDGQVVVATGASIDTVRAGTRRTMPRAGAPARLEAIRSMETMKLFMLRERGGELLRH